MASRHCFLAFVVALVLSACSANVPAPPAETSPTETTSAAATSDPAQNASSAESSMAEAAKADPAKPVEIPSISLSGSRQSQNTNQSTTAPTSQQSDSEPSSADQRRRELLNAMKPVQIMLGDWTGTTQKAVGDFKALTKPHWVWDFQTDPQHPAMVMTTDSNPHFETARLSYSIDDDQFLLQTTDEDGKVREFVGEFTESPREFQGDDQQMQIAYELALQQTNAESKRDTWQVTFQQQNNHRYLVELDRKSGSNFIRFDTIATQRAGTSFAKSDVGYGDRECIVSGGLGVTQVQFEGKKYWVCCSGCQAAFNEDPQSWIAENSAKTK